MSSDNKSDSLPDRADTVSKILVFHKLQPNFSFGSTNFSPRRFRKLLTGLAGKGYLFDSLDNLLNVPDSGKIALTFDDGYEHLRRHLPQLIEKYRITPTVFVPTAYIGKINRWDYSSLFQTCSHLDKSSIRELDELGVEFGSHGHSHRPLTGLTDKTLHDELNVSRKTLEDITGRAVTKISYPFGRFNQRVMETARDAGYLAGFTMNFPTPTDNPLATGRLPVYGFDTLFTVRQKISDGPLYAVEKLKARFTNRLSNGTGIYRWLSGR